MDLVARPPNEKHQRATLDELGDAEGARGTLLHNGRLIVALVVQRAVKTGDRPYRDIAEVVVLTAPDRDQLYIGDGVRPHDIDRRFVSDHDRAGPMRDVGHVHHMIRVGVLDHDEVGPVDLCVDHLGVAEERIGPGVDRASVARILTGSARVIRSGQVRVHQNHDTVRRVHGPG